MALSNFKVFQQYAYSTFMELLAFNINLFNGATRGGLILRGGANQGDFSEKAIYARISGLVRRRDAYGTGDVSEKELAMLLDRSVKVAAGTPPVRIDPHWWQWIQKSPDEAGVVLGKQLAEETLLDMIGVGMKAYAAAIGNVSALVHDATAGTMTLGALNTGASKFGDRASEIACWVMHSKTVFDIYGVALANSANLFTFGNVKVQQDGFGRPFVVADLPDLTVANGITVTADPLVQVDLYRTIGLVQGGVLIEQNPDFLDNTETKNGKENIIRTYQAQWSYNVGLKGFAWDSTNGGKSPTNAALATATNWDQFATSNKDLAGVLIKSK